MSKSDQWQCREKCITRGGTHATPAHPKALEESERALVHEDVLHTVPRAVELTMLVCHQADLDDVCVPRRTESELAAEPTCR